MYIPLLHWGNPTYHLVTSWRMQKEFQSIPNPFKQFSEGGEYIAVEKEHRAEEKRTYFLAPTRLVILDYR